MEAVIMSADARSAQRVYTEEERREMAESFALGANTVDKRYVKAHPEEFKDTKYIFSTWGMERFTEEEIAKYFPALECVFYAAGSVQSFAREFIKRGIRVFSAYKANAVPVTEFVSAQIILALKGYYTAARKCRAARYFASEHARLSGGVYLAKVGIIGVGAIGSAVCAALRSHDCEVLYYDPFLPADRAESLGIEEASLEEIFAECDVISNHLADKEELTGILNYALFSRMKPYATFINTGRGRQVDERGLARALREKKTRTALLDVTYPEPPSLASPLRRRRNVYLTPHIAGSTGREVRRMARYMIDEAKRVARGDDALYEITEEMLGTMA